MLFSRVKERVRGNSGWSGTDDLSNTRLEEAINYIYTRKIPDKIDWKGLQNWVYIDLVASDGDYDFASDLLNASGGSAIVFDDGSSRIRKLIPPASITPTGYDASFLHITYDKDSFWKYFIPQATPDTSQPTHLLIDGEHLFFRPIPNATYSYVFKCWADWRPDELTQAGHVIEPGWEEAVIAGATAVLLEDDEEDEQAAGWWGKYELKLKEIMSAGQAHVLGRVKQNW